MSLWAKGKTVSGESSTPGVQSAFFRISWSALGFQNPAWHYPPWPASRAAEGPALLFSLPPVKKQRVYLLEEPMCDKTYMGEMTSVERQVGLLPAAGWVLPGGLSHWDDSSWLPNHSSICLTHSSRICWGVREDAWGSVLYFFFIYS